MITNLWLIHLQEIFKEFAERDNTLRVRRDRVQVAKIFAPEATEDVVAIFTLIRDVAEWSEIFGKVLTRKHTIW